LFKVATWNINSIRVRLPHVLAWLQEHSPDVLCLQEIKMLDADFPVAAFEALGYQVSVSGQKTYNGVAIISKHVMKDVVTAFPDFDDPQKRILTATIGDVRIINLYIPNGSDVGSEKFHYKLTWLQHLKLFLTQELKQYQKIIVVGDFNIAPENDDVYDPQAWQNQVLFSSQERAEFQEILTLGFVDTFRLFAQPEKSYTWWDYRMAAFRRNMGLRIDHIIATPAVSAQCVSCIIDKKPRALEQPSDHAPVVAELDFLVKFPWGLPAMTLLSPSSTSGGGPNLFEDQVGGGIAS